jgi:hypothetical protein
VTTYKQPPDRSRQMILAIAAILGIALAVYAWYSWLS